MRLYWQDHRLNVSHLLPETNNTEEDYILLHPDTAKFIWFPDIYIGEWILLPFHNYKICCLQILQKLSECQSSWYLLHPFGSTETLLQDMQHSESVKVNFKLLMIDFRNNYDVACPMNFRNYPYDTQICKVKYESCEYFVYSNNERLSHNFYKFISDL